MFWNAPNTVCVVRAGLIPIAVVLLWLNNTTSRILGLTLIVISFLMDALDGYLARKLNQKTTIGSLVDVIADRITEYMLWVFFSYEHIIPVWVPLIVIPRGVLTDSTRSIAASKGVSVYDLPRSRLAKFLVTSRIMRITIGGGKLLLFILAGASMIWSIPESWIFWLSALVVIINLSRGIPVIAESSQILE